MRELLSVSFQGSDFEFVVGDRLIKREDEPGLLFFEMKPGALYFNGVAIYDPLPHWATRLEGYHPSGDLLSTRNHQGITPDTTIQGIIECFYKNEWSHSNLHVFAA